MRLSNAILWQKILFLTVVERVGEILFCVTIFIFPVIGCKCSTPWKSIKICLKAKFLQRYPTLIANFVRIMHDTKKCWFYIEQYCRQILRSLWHWFSGYPYQPISTNHISWKQFHVTQNWNILRKIYIEFMSAKAIWLVLRFGEELSFLGDIQGGDN